MGKEIQAAKEIYVGESFCVFIIRRGWSFWTGRKWQLAPYTAKLFGREEDAQAHIDKWKLKAQGSDQVSIRPAILTHK